MKTFKQLESQFKSQHPIQRSVSTGKYGFRRVCDCVDLSRFVYPTERSAQMARAEAARAYAATELSIAKATGE